MTDIVFEQIKKINKYGKEHWSARDLMLPLGYTRWENFEVAISRAKESCINSGQNGDPKKEEIALAQTYFAIQTRKREVHELQIDDHKRLHLRGEMKEHNKNLAKAAKEAGVINYANFQDFGYMGLYGGLRT